MPKRGDFSLVEKLYHPDCTHFDYRMGMELNFDMQSAVMSAYENITFGPYRVIYENTNFLCIHCYVRNSFTREPDYLAMISGIHYIDDKVIRHETRRKDLDYDPSEIQN